MERACGPQAHDSSGPQDTLGPAGWLPICKFHKSGDGPGDE
jgi:hypothetical protein